MDEVTEEWRKLHNEELNDLYFPPNIVQVIKLRRMKWVGHVACMGKRRGVCRVLVGKPEEKRSLGRPRHRWGNNIKMDHQAVGCGGMDWIDLAQELNMWWAIVNVGNFLTRSGRTLFHGVSTGRFIMFSMITNIYNKKTKGPTLMEFFTATGKVKKFFLTTRDV